MSSCAAFCFTCYQRVSCVSGTLDTLPTGTDAPFCRFAFSASPQCLIHPQRKFKPRTPPVFGTVRNAEGRWSLSYRSSSPDDSPARHLQHPLPGRNRKPSQERDRSVVVCFIEEGKPPFQAPETKWANKNRSTHLIKCSFARRPCPPSYPMISTDYIQNT